MKYLCGVMCIMIASLAFATIGILGTCVGSHIHCMVMVFCQNSITLLLLLPWFCRGGFASLQSKNLTTHSLRAFCGVLASFLLYLSLRNLDLFDVVLLENSTPIIIPFLAMVCIKEKISWAVWLSVFVGFLGIYFVVSPPGEVDIDWHLLLPISAAFFAASSFVLIKVLDKEETWKTILFYYFFFSTILSLPFLFVYPIHVVGAIEWVYLLGIGIAMAIAQGFIVLGYSFSDANKLAPFSYFEVVFGVLLGRFLLGLPFSYNTMEGMTFILLSGLIMLLFERRTSAISEK